MFYDVESLSNVFTVAWWLPKMRALILSYIDDDNIIQSDQDLEYIRKKIYNTHPKLQDVQVVFEDISQTGCISEYNDVNPNLGTLGMQSFAKRLGLANERTYHNASIHERHMEAGGIQYDPAYYPVKDTDPDYNPDLHGFRFGYNSTNYDMTILAHILAEVNHQYFRKDFINQPIYINKHGGSYPINAKDIRAFNDELFDPIWKNRMPMRLAHVDGTNPDDFGDFQKPAWILRKAWQLTGRYIDVSRLNEGLQRVGLKRLLGMLGHDIIESDKLINDTKIHNLEELADLFAYNVSDVVNLQHLFEHPVYQNGFNVRGDLLKTYPQTIYGQKKEPAKILPNGKTQEPQVDIGNYMNIRRDRLARDSTSAKFVEYAIAPYKPIKDIEVVSFLYPSEMEARRLGIEQKDILEETKRYFEENITDDPNHQAHKDFMNVYNFYDSIRGRNFNHSKAYKEYYGDGFNLPQHLQPTPRSYIKELMSKYNTNLFYHYRHSDGTVERSSCLANFSIGGIHGVEIYKDKFEKDVREYEIEKAMQDYVESLYKDATEAVNGPVYIKLPDHLEIPERIKNKVREDGTIRVREFVKSGSTKKKAYWRDVPKVELFKKNSSGNWTIADKYKYVSVGPAHHEDFTSYYPLLLSRLSAFINPSYHGYDENGDPADPYYGMFEERIAKRAIAKDPSQPKEVRESANREQESRKLLINAASGAGDASFENNILANNAIISMRIIGQLFAWRIGQAQTLAGARVPSTNTDGLYVMDIPAEVNDRILKETARDMYVGIEPERLDRFVSKDSNNRLEVRGGKITSASGGTLNSWQGPQPTKSLDHPAITDHILAKYLADPRIKNPTKEPYNDELVKELMLEFIQEHIKNGTPQEALRFFQWILSSSNNTHRYVYLKQTNIHTGQVTIKKLQDYNRIFLIKEDGYQVRNEVYLATRRSINASTWKKRIREYQNGERLHSQLWEHDEYALEILKQNGLDLLDHNNDSNSNHYKDEAQTQKIRSMPNEQHIEIYNKSILDLPNNQAIQMIQMLDLPAYLEMVKQTFRTWYNG